MTTTEAVGLIASLVFVVPSLDAIIKEIQSKESYARSLAVVGAVYVIVTPFAGTVAANEYGPIADDGRLVMGMIA